MPTQYGMGQAPQFPRQEPIRYNSQSSLPGDASYQGGQAPPPVYTPPLVQTPAPVQTPQPVDTPAPVQTAEPAKTKKKMPNWMVKCDYFFLQSKKRLIFFFFSFLYRNMVVLLLLVPLLQAWVLGPSMKLLKTLMKKRSNTLLHSITRPLHPRNTINRDPLKKRRDIALKATSNITSLLRRKRKAVKLMILSGNNTLFNCIINKKKHDILNFLRVFKKQEKIAHLCFFWHFPRRGVVFSLF
jgi:hypothetical protein